MSVAKLYVDGGVLGKNPSVEGIYWSVGREHDDGRVELLAERTEDRSYYTNNDAEYMALLDALRFTAHMEGVTKVIIHSDSQLIVNQFNGNWSINEARLREHCSLARRSAEFLSAAGVEVQVVWVRRAENVKRLGH